MIVEESGIQYHYYTHIYRLLHKWAFRQKIPRKVHVNTASEEEEEQFKKRAQGILDNLPEGFAAVSLDESFFSFDSIVRKVWIEENSRPNNYSNRLTQTALSPI
jgi:Winged helix-turn helix